MSELPRRFRRRRIVAAAIALVVVVAVASTVWVWRQIDPPGEAGEAIELTVAEGSSTDDIGEVLAEKGVIASPTVWRWYLRFHGAGPFRAGRYRFRLDSSIGDALDVLAAGPAAPPVRRVTIPEGLTTAETLDRLARADVGLDVDRAALASELASGRIRSRYQPADQDSSEGILFPDTYEIDDRADAGAVLALLVAQLDRTLDELDVQHRAAARGLSPYEVLVVASLIEEESKLDEERSKVARVIYNRLERGIALGIDATSRYEAELAGRDRADVDFDSDSPYNTRRQPGLPPTPIASPGRASLVAALEPADGDWIYYVLADGDGRHVFTASASEFERAKRACRDAGLGCG